jgi:hypothetical protein
VVEVQYFERARLEFHPDRTATNLGVVVGRLGMEVPILGRLASPMPEGLRGQQVILDKSTIKTPQVFFQFWVRNGGPELFGYPISPVLMEVVRQGKPLAVQYYERARFEYHPDNAGTSKEVRLTDLGTQVFARKYGAKPTKH